MKITVLGSGYVGLVVAACFAEVGNEVVCMDVNSHKIAQLQQGIVPIYEPGLAEMIILAQQTKMLQFTTDIKTAVQHAECIFIAVGTPPDAEGKADLRFVSEVASSIGEYIQNYTIIVNKSTVPIGTKDKVEAIITHALNLRQQAILFDVVSNPEFLKEGAAIEDFRQPDRIIVGIDNPRAKEKLIALYAPFNHDNNRLMLMDTRSAELTKYASNAMLATKISFMNEMANLAEKVGADIEKVRMGMGADPRIGYHFTHPGCGYGGSCFGKDVQALIHTAELYNNDLKVLRAVEDVNHLQKKRLIEKIVNYYGEELKNKTLAVWGLSFKPETDDMRDAPSVVVIQYLLEAGVNIQAFDPQAMDEAKKIFNNFVGFSLGGSPEEVLEGANGLVIFTEWRLFKNPDLDMLKNKLSPPVIFDGRNCYDPDRLKENGIQYYGIGRGG